jgi:hypothetical protein
MIALSLSTVLALAPARSASGPAGGRADPVGRVRLIVRLLESECRGSGRRASQSGRDAYKAPVKQVKVQLDANGALKLTVTRIRNKAIISGIGRRIRVNRDFAWTEAMLTSIASWSNGRATLACLPGGPSAEPQDSDPTAAEWLVRSAVFPHVSPPRHDVDRRRKRR